MSQILVCGIIVRCGSRPSPESKPNLERISIIRNKCHKIEKWSYPHGCEMLENLTD